MNVIPVVLAGGKGTRLAPLSKSYRPKQFIHLLTNRYSFFQTTVLRLRYVFKEEKIIIATNIEYVNHVKEQLKEIKEDNYTLILEPESINTFSSILLATKISSNADVLFITPADLLISNIETFSKQVKGACRLSYNKKNHTLFGIHPTEANENFGYIKISQNNTDKQVNSHAKNKNDYSILECFEEKPNKEKAEQFINDGNYLWNSGMFVLQKQRFLQDVEKFQKKSYKIYQNICFEEIENAITPDRSQFISIKNTSIDYAIMNKLADLLCMKAKFDWLDIGNWKTLSLLIMNGTVDRDIVRRLLK